MRLSPLVVRLKFTATQAAQKLIQLSLKKKPVFTATQAAQKLFNIDDVTDDVFTATQAAQKCHK